MFSSTSLPYVAYPAHTLWATALFFFFFTQKGQTVCGRVFPADFHVANRMMSQCYSARFADMTIS